MLWSFQKRNVNVKFCYITGRARPDWAYEFPDWTPKFAGQVLPDRTESGLIFLNVNVLSLVVLSWVEPHQPNTPYVDARFCTMEYLIIK